MSEMLHTVNKKAHGKHTFSGSAFSRPLHQVYYVINIGGIGNLEQQVRYKPARQNVISGKGRGEHIV